MNVLEWMFGKRMTYQEQLRAHQRTLEKTIRELDRERVKLENQEAKLVNDIRASAKKGMSGAVRVQAKDLVRTRKHIQKFYQMRTQIQAISLRIQTVRSNEQMMQSMKGATTLLGSMNRQMNLPALQRIATQFQRESDMMEHRQEMMDDAIDDMMGGEEDEDEEEEVVQQVLDEIGVGLGAQLSDVPQSALADLGPPNRIAQPLGAMDSLSAGSGGGIGGGIGGGASGGGAGGKKNMPTNADADDLEARLRNLSGGK